MGGNNVRLFGEDNPTAGIEVLPYWEFFNRARDYSVVFNRFSMTEIQRDRVDKYPAEIETRSATFLSINHEIGPPSHINLHQIIAERGKLECRFRYPYWIRKRFVEELFAPSRR